MKFTSAVLPILALSAVSVKGYDASRSDNLAVYWGQNSYGATNGGDTANWQKTISNYCQDTVINTILISFVDVFFSTGGLPDLNLANSCSAADDGVFPGTGLANCQKLTAGIQACQAAGKAVVLSIGGASGAATFNSDAQGRAFADTIWNLFLGGSSSTRPFGAAVLDGVDLDIEGGGPTGFAAFVTQLRTHTDAANKKYYISAAPQCPFPDAYLGSVINAVPFDIIYVQFYNNFCSVASYPSTNWNFGTWDNWAKTVSPNKNVKIFIGAPAAASISGYVSAAQLGAIGVATRAQYSSFGGIMLWDASQAYANGRYDVAVKNIIAGGGSGTTTPPTTTTSKTTTTTTTPTTTTTTATTTTTTGSGSCAGVAAWVSNVAYVGGTQATYNGHLWQAKWWSQADVPGGAAGVWTDLGACTSLFATAKVVASVETAAKLTVLGASVAQVKTAKTVSETGTRKNSRVFRF
ncbi:glycoside hydrolase [Mycena belliarum]|uniref:chitinase n=1 Tax=Mycena belliarum TaxID=1033014 RepID=A0AAD6UJE5_9AGAR|nr:glycoside hydrolase [Mycena belliae]